MFVNQSKTGKVVHPLVPQAPLFLHPAGKPPLPEEQLSHPIRTILYIGGFYLLNYQHIAKKAKQPRFHKIKRILIEIAFKM
jgi:hypothetical protein